MDLLRTGAVLYNSSPTIWATASAIPVRPNCADTVLLLDVLEHLPAPATAIDEAARVLKPGGQLLLSVPFLYPTHDAPYDYQRWTLHGLRKLLSARGLSLEEVRCQGTGLETAILLLNIALAGHALAWVQRKSVLLLLIPFVMMMVLFSNLVAGLAARLARPSDFMPFSVWLVASKTGTGTSEVA